jgi:hypothetical protein
MFGSLVRPILRFHLPNTRVRTVLDVTKRGDENHTPDGGFPELSRTADHTGSAPPACNSGPSLAEVSALTLGFPRRLMTSLGLTHLFQEDLRAASGVPGAGVV